MLTEKDKGTIAGVIACGAGLILCSAAFALGRIDERRLAREADWAVLSGVNGTLPRRCECKPAPKPTGSTGAITTSP